jgi:hypothetical protein
MLTATCTFTVHVAVPPSAYPLAFPGALASETIPLPTRMRLTPALHRVLAYPMWRELVGSYSVPGGGLALHLGSPCPPGYFGMPPGSCDEVSSLSPCPFWTKPITHVGLLNLTTVQKCVCVPIHMQLCSTGFPGGFRVTAFQTRLIALRVSRRGGACASLRHLKERNFTSTSPKLSRSTISTSHPRPVGRFERTDRSVTRFSMRLSTRAGRPGGGDPI